MGFFIHFESVGQGEVKSNMAGRRGGYCKNCVHVLFMACYQGSPYYRATGPSQEVRKFKVPSVLLSLSIVTFVSQFGLVHSLVRLRDEGRVRLGACASEYTVSDIRVWFRLVIFILRLRSKDLKRVPYVLPFDFLLIHITNSLVAEPEGSTPLIAKPDIGHDPEPVTSTSGLHNLSP
jgi:hypothetical protein